jgi:hypothetical protein
MLDYSCDPISCVTAQIAVGATIAWIGFQMSCLALRYDFGLVMFLAGGAIASTGFVIGVM